MKIYKIKTESNSVQILSPVNNVDRGLNLLTFNCESRNKKWEEIEVYIQNPATKPKNFFSMPSGILVCDDSALNVCRTVFEMSGEILPVHVERGSKLYVINVSECMNGLNNDTTEWAYYKDGSKSRILKYGFYPDRVLNESSIFKIPETAKIDIFCWAYIKNPNDEFYHLYHEHGLTGLVFEELYSS